MAGLSDTGFVVKRLDEIITSLRSKAVELFKDLVPEGEAVDTSDSTAIGRQIGLIAPSLHDLWEAAQHDYSAFDVNSATGIALENLVFLGGETRNSDSYSTVPLVFEGDNGTTISTGKTVQSSTSNVQWQTASSVALSPSNAVGISVKIGTVAAKTAYTITYATAYTTNAITFTSGATATEAVILQGLLDSISSSHASLTATVSNGVLRITKVDVLSSVNFAVSNNLNITKCQKIGEALATTPGPNSAEAKTITSILTPVLGWDSVYNPAAASEGAYEETDEELRRRFKNTKFEKAVNSLESLYSALISVHSVQQVYIYENEGETVDAYGIPPHSFMPVVVGGLSSAIAKAIWSKKPSGIKSYGDTFVDVTDSEGFTRRIAFKRPTQVPLYITLSLTTDNDFPATGPDDIRTALINYAESKFKVGEPVIFSRLYTPINSIAGHQIDDLKIGTSAKTLSSANVNIAFDSIASLSSANITINT
jgi:uncharacterized phage protein gp47/JayE